MVLQVLADALERVHHGNAVLLQQRGRSNAGQLQQLRRLQRAGGKDHFAPRDGSDVIAALPIADARRARVPSKSTRVACALVSMRRFARLRAGFRYATAVEQRRPRRVVSW